MSVGVCGLRPGVHGVPTSQFSPSYAAFIAVVPILRYSFVGTELQSTAGEEMVDQTRDLPAAIGRAGWLNWR